MDPTNRYTGYPVVAYNEDGTIYKVYPSRAAAAKEIADERGSQPSTADKEIRLRLRSGKSYNGFIWKYQES